MGLDSDNLAGKAAIRHRDEDKTGVCVWNSMRMHIDINSNQNQNHGLIFSSFFLLFRSSVLTSLILYFSSNPSKDLVSCYAKGRRIRGFCTQPSPTANTLRTKGRRPKDEEIRLVEPDQRLEAYGLRVT